MSSVISFPESTWSFLPLVRSIIAVIVASSMRPRWRFTRTLSPTLNCRSGFFLAGTKAHLLRSMRADIWCMIAETVSVIFSSFGSPHRCNLSRSATKAFISCLPLNLRMESPSSVETARFKQSSLRHVGTRINRRRDDNTLTRPHSSRHRDILSTCTQGKHPHSAETFLTISQGSHRQGWDDTIADGIDTSPNASAGINGGVFSTDSLVAVRLILGEGAQ